jgi:hypothetical protein
MKKNNQNELLRLQSVIENDRLSVGNGFNDLLINDLTKLLKDYFDFSNNIEVEITKSKGEYIVSFSLIASRIKTFNFLPK